MNDFGRALKATLPFALAAVALVVLGDTWKPPHPFGPDVPEWQPFHALVRWDGGWYGEIAQNGYWIAPGQQSPVAFFPFYPLCLRALGWLGLGRWFAGPLLSFVAGTCAVALLSRWAARVKPEAAGTTFDVARVYPFAVYLFGIMYSDALFLLLVVGAFTLLEDERPWWAALVGAAAAATRPVAPALVLGLLVRSLEKRRVAGQPFRVRDFAPGLAGLGLAAWMGFLWWRFGDPFAFAHVQGVPGWDQPPGWRSWLKLSFFETMFPRVAPLVAVRLGGHALLTLGGLALLPLAFKRLGWGYGVYCLLALGMPAVSSKDFQSLGRYAMAAFPLFLVWATVLDAHPRWRRPVLALSAAIAAAVAVALGMGGYVA